MREVCRQAALADVGKSGEEPSWDAGVLWLGLAFLVLGLACRLHVYLLAFPIWRDEAALALNFVSRDFRGLLLELDNFQIAPLLFLWLEKAVYEYLGGSMPLLRLVPFAAGMGGLILFWRLARRCLDPLSAALSVGILAVAQTPIHLASMVKPYSLDLCAATLLLTLAVRTVQTPERRGSLVFLALVIPFIVAASYPAIFVAGAVSLVLSPVVWKHGGRAGRFWFLAFNVLCAAAFLAQLRFVGREGHDPTLPTVAEYMADFWRGGFLPRQPLPACHWMLRHHLGHLFSYPLAFNGGGLLGVLLVALGGQALYRQRQFALLGLCLLPLALNLVAAVLQRYPYAADQRLEQHLVPGICLLLGAGMADGIRRLTASPRLRRWAAASVAALLALLALADAVHDARHPYHDVEAAWAREVAHYLRREVREDDRIICSCTDRFVLNCIRWQLLAFAGRGYSPNEGSRQRLRQEGGRLWLIDQMLAQASAHEEPAERDPLQSLPADEQKHWHVLQRQRFLTRQHAAAAEERYYYCCDLHVLEPTW